MTSSRSTPCHEKYKGVIRGRAPGAAREEDGGGDSAPHEAARPNAEQDRRVGIVRGAIGGKFEYVAHGDPEAERKVKGDFPDKPRNITAKPGKRGGYGTRGFTISESSGKKFGVAGEYAYVADEYDVERARPSASGGWRVRKKSRETHSGRPGRGKKAGLEPEHDLGGAKGAGFAGEYRYEPEGPGARAAESPPEKAWRVSRAQPRGDQQAARYAEDPAGAQGGGAARELRELEREKMNEKPSAALTRGGGKVGATPIRAARMNFAKGGDDW